MRRSRALLAAGARPTPTQAGNTPLMLAAAAGRADAVAILLDAADQCAATPRDAADVRGPPVDTAASSVAARTGGAGIAAQRERPDRSGSPPRRTTMTCRSSSEGGRTR
jgi:ankyrin repeat protein